MPTAPKIVAAVLFGFVAWFASALVVPYLPPNTRLGWFHEVAALIGALMGWTLSGAWAGQGLRPAVGYGLTTMVATVFWCVFVFAGQEMIERSLQVRYHGPVEALTDMVKLMLDDTELMAKADVLIWLVVGALFSGIVTELSAREWT
jgi:hypothetical protein